MKRREIKTCLKFIFTLIIMTSLFSSCLTKPRSSRKKSSGSSTSSSKNDTVNEPSFNNDLNYMQDGSNISSATFSVPSDLSAGFYLRGKQVDSFIKNGNETTVLCLTAYFPSSPTKQILTLAATPNKFSNFELNTKEHYYYFDPSNKSINQTFCQKSGLVTQMSNSLPGKIMAFSILDLCPNCTLNTLTSDPVALFSSSGGLIDKINTTYLRINLGKSTGQNSTANFCTSSSECQAKGFHCCSDNICVNDKQLRTGVDQSSVEFQQALSDIADNPNTIFNYPQFYHLCSTLIITDPTPTDPQNPYDEAKQRFEKLQDLYNCANPIEGEMALCAVTFENALSDSTTGVPYNTKADDRNFNTTYTGSMTLNKHSIEKIKYGEKTLYKNGLYDSSEVHIGIANSGNGNDNLTDTQLITLFATLPTNTLHSNLTITYKVDGSCEKVSSLLSKCYKEYIQGENLGKVTDHYPASNEFLLPLYADLNKTITVEVDGSQKTLGAHWQLQKTSPARVIFNGSSLQVFDTQKVKITFFVDTTVNNVNQSHENALLEIKDICNCEDTSCNLKPKEDTNGQIVDYICDYPANDNNPAPLYQEVLLDAKSVPHPYFDETGVLKDQLTSDLSPQEGIKFEYLKNNLLKPNNTSQYVGFNEIYGSFSLEATAAKPSKIVRVDAGKTYDIFVDSGSFSTCFYCGNDYYSNLAKLFPQNFLYYGGGYRPNPSITSKQETRDYRGDDLLFGRACWVPATMLPWSHRAMSDRQQQRISRLRAQHFMFANGYSRDWYGFDYGSVIGSFDGVNWFSVGNQRRIKAKSSRLFLALNAYFGDQTLSSTYQITVSDSSKVPASGATITNDFESDGAECQKYHVCESDADCKANLGWDYTCESITGLSTNWPVFDSNGSEIPDSEQFIDFLTLFSANNKGGPKRCIYRGRGTPCYTDPTVSSSNSYNGTDKVSYSACSQNNYCQQFLDGVNQAKFNRKIARYGKSVRYQNASTDVSQSDADEFGLGSKILGRPFDWSGTEAIDAETQASLTHNKVIALCIPGRTPGPSPSFVAFSNQSRPTSSYLGDQVNGIGMTMTGVGPNQNYLTSCQVLDSAGNEFFLDPNNMGASMSDTNLVELSSRQSISSNAFSILENLSGNDFVKSFESSFIEEASLQENRCLRAPGSLCFSDFECAPSRFTKSLVNNIDPDNIPDLDSTPGQDLSKYEVQFWQEELVCSQKNAPQDPDFNLNENRCCRETGKIVTIGTLYNINSAGTITPAPGRPNFDVSGIPGVNIPMSDPRRYSRMATVHDLVKSGNEISHPPLMTAEIDSCGTACVPKGTAANEIKIDNQWKTFSKMAQRTCCSQHWVREFHEDNGRGHQWGPEKTQVIPKESFSCFNWDICSTCTSSTPSDSMSCEFLTEEPDDPGCPARTIPAFEAKHIFDWMNSLELLGIPQITVLSEANSNIQCQVDPNDARNIGTSAMNDIYKAGGIAEFSDNSFAAHDKANFNDGLNMIFSEDQISCCLPAGTTVSDGADPKNCCTGFINPETKKCQLKDYSNVSVFFNRFVSSMAKDLPESAIDPTSGYVRDPNTVMRMACQLNVCASNVVAFGIALTDLKVRGHESKEYRTRRFIDGNDLSNNFSEMADLWDNGLRWNEDVYCVPSGINLGIAFDCSSSF